MLDDATVDAPSHPSTPCAFIYTSFQPSTTFFSEYERTSRNSWPTHPSSHRNCSRAFEPVASTSTTTLMSTQSLPSSRSSARPHRPERRRSVAVDCVLCGAAAGRQLARVPSTTYCCSRPPATTNRSAAQRVAAWVSACAHICPIAVRLNCARCSPPRCCWSARRPGRFRRCRSTIRSAYLCGAATAQPTALSAHAVKWSSSSGWRIGYADA